MTITVKPHHFMDIIKLYGKGIEYFVPDEKMGHDFYRIANLVLADHEVRLKLTTDGDDICRPCRKYTDHCTDPLPFMEDFAGKDDYNRILDERMITLYSLSLDQEYTAEELCRRYIENHSFIFQVWREENDEITTARHDWFVAGAEKYLAKQ